LLGVIPRVTLLSALGTHPEASGTGESTGERPDERPDEAKEVGHAV
jgi:hypothetical protein